MSSHQIYCEYNGLQVRKRHLSYEIFVKFVLQSFHTGNLVQQISHEYLQV